MNYVSEAWIWIGDHLYGPDGVLVRLGEHLLYTVLAVVIAAVLAVPIGWFVGHTRRGRGFVVVTAGAARALPTLGVLTLVGLVLGIGLLAPLVALIVLAFPSILAGAYAGVEAIEPPTLDAAKAMGSSPWQVLTTVEIPLGFPLLLGGLRSAVLQVVATATLAAYTGAGGLGRFLFLGLKTQDYPQMLAAAILVVLLAIVLDLGFEALAWMSRRPYRLAHA